MNAAGTLLFATNEKTIANASRLDEPNAAPAASNAAAFSSRAGQASFALAGTGFDGHLAQTLSPAKRGILRFRLKRLPARIGSLIDAGLLVRQPGGFGHRRGFLDIML
jgi:hypothetical protein